MIVMFSGHRDKFTTEESLDQIRDSYPGAVWLHGGAIGFDSQVETYARRHGIKTEVHKPDYKTHGRAAPIIRNREMITRADLVILCYDGRQKGGTFYVFTQAQKQNKHIIQTPAHRHKSI